MTTLSTTKPVAGTEVDATALSSNFTAIEAVVNGNIDETNIATGLVYSPSKIKQGGAAVGETLVWDGAAWVAGPGADISWTTYTPALTTTGTQAVLNNGTLTGRYARFGDLVRFSLVLTIGSTTTLGTGFYNYSIPVNGNTSGEFANTHFSFGLGSFNDISTGTIYTATLLYAGSQVGTLWGTGSAPTRWGASSGPVVPATGDVIQISGMYEAA